MEVGAITGHIDVAQVVRYVFGLFFFGLLFYLQRETRREGYPLVMENGQVEKLGPVFMPDPKVFKTLDGRTVVAPDPARADTRALRAEQLVGGPGSPFVPTGDPMTSGMGPGSWAERPDIPDLTHEKHNRIVPMRIATDFTIEPRDPDPRGMPIYGADGKLAGKGVDCWIDRSEYMLRYIEIELEGTAVAGATAAEDADGNPQATATTPLRVLMPINFAEIDTVRGRISTDAIMAHHFAGVPRPKSPDQITLLEEEKVMAYYGGGLLYADPSRQEPLL